MNDLSNKIIVITGATSGIGKALAEIALRQGTKVAVCARKLEQLQTIFGTNENVYLAKADVSRWEDCATFVSGIIEKWGRIDILINNAGISMRALFDEADLSVIQELMNINFWGSVHMTKLCLPQLMQSKGVVCSVSSIAGYRGLPGRTGYSASKFALQGFMEALRTELLQTGVHVMWVSPGFTNSNIRNVARNAQGQAQAESPLEEGKLMSSEECASIILQGVLLRKRTVVMTGQGKLTVWLNKLLPSLADKLVYKHFLKEPGSPLTKYANR